MAGRPKGKPKGSPKTGGRKKGTLNKLTLAKVAAVEMGLTPLDYMLSLMCNEGLETSMRFEAAKAAAPYCHNRLASVEHHGKDGEGGAVIITWAGPRPKAGNADS